MRAIHRISTAFAKSASRGRAAPGWHADGGGLFMRVKSDGNASWVFKFERGGRRRELGLGAVGAVPLSLARDKAAAMRLDLGAGKEPQPHRQVARKVMTFSQACTAYVDAKQAEFRNEKHIKQWRATLDTYCKSFANRDVAAVDTDAVLGALEPIWTTIPETAGRLRGRIESVLAWAMFKGLRPQGDNPARWVGHLNKHLPKLSKVRTVKHHAALPWKEVPAFMKALAGQPGVSAQALAFTVLTAARTGEVIGAEWCEFDLGAGVWTVPAPRMKAGKEHRVPLSAAALAILEDMKAHGGRYAFPGGKKDRPLSNMAMDAVLRRMERKDITVHGMRSTFRDWAGEATEHPREVIEHALAHQLKDRAEAAYARGTLLEKRRVLMDDWAAHCAKAEV